MLAGYSKSLSGSVSPATSPNFFMPELRDLQTYESEIQSNINMLITCSTFNYMHYYYYVDTPSLSLSRNESTTDLFNDTQHTSEDEDFDFGSLRYSCFNSFTGNHTSNRTIGAGA